eukprot:c24808_g1_i1 orf=81-245(+)
MFFEQDLYHSNAFYLILRETFIELGFSTPFKLNLCAKVFDLIIGVLSLYRGVIP